VTSALHLGAVPAGGRVAALHAALVPQKDNVCGAFWGTLALRLAGLASALGEQVDQELVAREAGTCLPRHPDPAASLPPGASGDDRYRIELPLTDDPAAVGTAARPLGEAVERLSEGRLRVLPVAGPWTAARVLELLDAAAEAAPDTLLVANGRTGHLWASHAPLAAAWALLAGEPDEGPPAEWDVGHFWSLAGVLRGAGGALVVVRDTYAELGRGGYHLQPPARMAAALRRDDGNEGGVLCICPAAEAAALEARLGGFELRYWDNGSPDG
jgi:hypothetical protein